jgi:transcriptional regulator of acetoin/glycerol metabolism
MVVSEHSALANTIGLQYLSHESHALLWDYLLARPGADVATQASVPVEGGRREAIIQRVTGVAEEATYLLRLLPSSAETAQGPTRRASGHRQRRPAARPAAPEARSLHPVMAIDDQLTATARTAVCLAIDGAPGTGKRTAAEKLLHRLHSADRPLAVNLSVARGSPVWYRQAANALAAGRGVILIHLKDLPRRHVNLVKALAQHAATARPDHESNSSPSRCSLVLTVDLATSPPHIETLVRQVAAIVTLPTLSAMRDQIPRIAIQMLSELPTCHRPSQLATTALQALMRWSWPGNLTELHTTLEQTAKRTTGPTVHPGHLPLHIQTAAQRRSLSDMQSAERDAIIAALHRAGGNRSAAATALGIGRTTLYRKLRSYQIQT